VRSPSCGWCGLPLSPERVYRCKDRSCNAPVCPPDQRDCGFEHWKYRHSARPVVEVKGP
jgi:hypothetical protein